MLVNTPPHPNPGPLKSPRAVSHGDLTLRLHWFLHSFNNKSYSIPDPLFDTDRVGLCFYSLNFCFAFLGEGRELEPPRVHGFVSLSALASFPKNRRWGGVSCPVLQPCLPEWWDFAAFFPLLMLKESVLHLVWCCSQQMCRSYATHKNVINVSSHNGRKGHSRLAVITLFKHLITWSYFPILRMLIEVCSLERTQ